MKAISLGLVFTFFLQDLSFANPDSKSFDFLKFQQFQSAKWAESVLPSIPSSMATVEDAWHGGPQIVILLQDAHTNPSGQLNLAKSLDLILAKNIQSSPRRRGSERLDSRLRRNDDKIQVFVEGGFGNDSLSFLRQYGSTEQRKNIARSYLQKGLIHGEEYLDLISDHDFQLWGVEDKDLYRQALELYRGVASERGRFESYLDKIQNTIEVLKPRILNPVLLSFENSYEKYRKGETSFVVYADILMSQPIKGRYPNFKRLQKLKALEKKLDRLKVSPKHQKTILERIIRSSKALNYSDLMTEQKAMENEVFQSLAQTPDEQNLLRSVRTLYFYRKLFNFQLTPEEYAEFKKAGDSIKPLTGFLNLKIMEQKQFYEHAAFLEPGFDEIVTSAEAFYTLTLKRDEKFIENMLNQAEQQRVTAVGVRLENTEGGFRTDNRRQDPLLSVLITGGYHTANLKSILRSKNISYISLRPQVLHETNQKRYEQILLGSNSTPKFLSVPASMLQTVSVMDAGLMGRDTVGLLRNDFEKLPISTPEVVSGQQKGGDGARLALNAYQRFREKAPFMRAETNVYRDQGFKILNAEFGSPEKSAMISGELNDRTMLATGGLFNCQGAVAVSLEKGRATQGTVLHQHLLPSKAPASDDYLAIKAQEIIEAADSLPSPAPKILISSFRADTRALIVGMMPKLEAALKSKNARMLMIERPMKSSAQKAMIVATSESVGIRTQKPDRTDYPDILLSWDSIRSLLDTRFNNQTVVEISAEELKIQATRLAETVEFDDIKARIDEFISKLNASGVDLEKVKKILNINKIYISDDTLRDGIQSLKPILTTESKKKLAKLLFKLGLPLEATSFGVYASMADSPEFARWLAEYRKDHEVPTVRHLLFNQESWSKLRESDARPQAIAVWTSASKEYLKDNQQVSERYIKELEKSIAIETGADEKAKLKEKMAKKMERAARIDKSPLEDFTAKVVPMLNEIAGYERETGHSIEKHGYISAIPSYSKEKVTFKMLAANIRALRDNGVTKIWLSDTSGRAKPEDIRKFSRFVLKRNKKGGPFEGLEFGWHLHDHGLGLVNVLVALEEGMTHFDGSIGGIGGSADAKEKTGNVALEDLAVIFSLLKDDNSIRTDDYFDVAILIQELFPQRNLFAVSHILGLHALKKDDQKRAIAYLNQALKAASRLAADGKIAYSSELNMRLAAERGRSAQISPEEVEAYKRLAEQLAGQIKKHLPSGGIVFFDGLSGGGKTTLTRALAPALRLIGVSTPNEPLDIDLFLIDPEKKAAIFKKIVSAGKPFTTEYEDTYQVEEVSRFFDKLRSHFLNQDVSQETRIMVPNAYHRNERKMGPKEFTFKKGDVLLVDWTCAHLLNFERDAIPHLHVRLKSDSRATTERFVERSRQLYKGDDAFIEFRRRLIELKNQAWELYAQKSAADVDFVADLTVAPSKWVVREDGARLSSGASLDFLIFGVGGCLLIYLAGPTCGFAYAMFDDFRRLWHRMIFRFEGHVDRIRKIRPRSARQIRRIVVDIILDLSSVLMTFGVVEKFIKDSKFMDREKGIERGDTSKDGSGARLAVKSSLLSDPWMGNLILRHLGGNADIQTFLTVDHPLKEKVFREVDALRPEDVLSQAQKGLSLTHDSADRWFHLYQRGELGDASSSTGINTVKRIFLNLNQSDLAPSLDQMSARFGYDAASVDLDISRFGEDEEATILRRHYLLLRAMRIYFESAPLFDEDDLEDAEGYLAYLSSPAVIDPDLGVSSESVARFLSFADLLIRLAKDGRTDKVRVRQAAERYLEMLNRIRASSESWSAKLERIDSPLLLTAADAPGALPETIAEINARTTKKHQLIKRLYDDGKTKVALLEGLMGGARLSEGSRLSSDRDAQHESMLDADRLMHDLFKESIVLAFASLRSEEISLESVRKAMNLHGPALKKFIGALYNSELRLTLKEGDRDRYATLLFYGAPDGGFCQVVTALLLDALYELNIPSRIERIYIQDRPVHDYAVLQTPSGDIAVDMTAGQFIRKLAYRVYVGPANRYSARLFSVIRFWISKRGSILTRERRKEARRLADEKFGARLSSSVAIWQKQATKKGSYPILTMAKLREALRLVRPGRQRVFQIRYMPNLSDMRWMLHLDFEVEIIYLDSGEWLLVTGDKTNVELTGELNELAKQGRIIIDFHTHNMGPGYNVNWLKMPSEHDIANFVNMGTQNFHISPLGVTFIRSVDGRLIAGKVGPIDSDMVWNSWRAWRAARRPIGSRNERIQFRRFARAMGVEITFISWKHSARILSKMADMRRDYNPLSERRSAIGHARKRAERFRYYRRKAASKIGARLALNAYQRFREEAPFMRVATDVYRGQGFKILNAEFGSPEKSAMISGELNSHTMLATGGLFNCQGIVAVSLEKGRAPQGAVLHQHLLPNKAPVLDDYSAAKAREIIEAIDSLPATTPKILVSSFRADTRAIIVGIMPKLEAALKSKNARKLMIERPMKSSAQKAMIVATSESVGIRYQRPDRTDYPDILLSWDSICSLLDTRFNNQTVVEVSAEELFALRSGQRAQGARLAYEYLANAAAMLPLHALIVKKALNAENDWQWRKLIFFVVGFSFVFDPYFGYYLPLNAISFFCHELFHHIPVFLMGGISAVGFNPEATAFAGILNQAVLWVPGVVAHVDPPGAASGYTLPVFGHHLPRFSVFLCGILPFSMGVAIPIGLLRTGIWNQRPWIALFAQGLAIYWLFLGNITWALSDLHQLSFVFKLQAYQSLLTAYGLGFVIYFMADTAIHRIPAAFKKISDIWSESDKESQSGARLADSDGSSVTQIPQRLKQFWIDYAVILRLPGLAAAFIPKRNLAGISFKGVVQGEQVRRAWRLKIAEEWTRLQPEARDYFSREVIGKFLNDKIEKAALLRALDAELSKAQDAEIDQMLERDFSRVIEKFSGVFIESDFTLASMSEHIKYLAAVVRTLPEPVRQSLEPDLKIIREGFANGGVKLAILRSFKNKLNNKQVLIRKRSEFRGQSYIFHRAKLLLHHYLKEHRQSAAARLAKEQVGRKILPEETVIFVACVRQATEEKSAKLVLGALELDYVDNGDATLTLNGSQKVNWKKITGSAQAERVQIQMPMADFKMLYEQNNLALADLKQGQGEAAGIVDLDQFGPTLKGFDEIILPILIREMSLAKKDAKFILRSTDTQLIEKVKKRIEAMEPSLLDNLVEDGTDLGDIPAALLTTPGGVLDPKTIPAYHKTLEEGDIPNFRAQIRIGLKRARMRKMDDQNFADIFSLMRRLTGHEIQNASDLDNPELSAIPALAKLTLNQAFSAARLADRLIRQAA